MLWKLWKLDAMETDDLKWCERFTHRPAHELRYAHLKVFLLGYDCSSGTSLEVS